MPKKSVSRRNRLVDPEIVRRFQQEAGFIRLPTLFSVLFPYLIGRATLPQRPLDEHLGADLMLLLAVGVLSAVWNTLADFAIDQQNGKAPYPTLAETQRHARPWISLALLGWAGALLWDPSLTAYSLAVLALGVGYNSLKLSHRPFLGLLSFALYYRLLPLLLGLWRSETAWPEPVLLLLAGLFLLRLSSGLYKDFHDLTGDLAHGKTTFLGSYGQPATAWTSFILGSFGALATLAAAVLLRGPLSLVSLGLGAAYLALTLQRLPLLKADTTHAQQEKGYFLVVGLDNLGLVLLLAGFLLTPR